MCNYCKLNQELLEDEPCDIHINRMINKASEKLTYLHWFGMSSKEILKLVQAEKKKNSFPE